MNFSSIKRLWSGGGPSKYGKVEPYKLGGSPLKRSNARRYSSREQNPVSQLLNHQERQQNQKVSLWAEDVFKSTSKPDAEQARLRAKAASDFQKFGMRINGVRITASDLPKFGEPLTKYNPEKFMAIPHGWQEYLQMGKGKTSADKAARYDRLANSLEHYAVAFHHSKEARESYRANYAQMKDIATSLVPALRIPNSPHDSETW